jgi:L-amino acid N-acyltransferase YncA
MDKVTFQKAGENDLDKILEIYNFYIATTTATFDKGEISREELTQRIFISHEKYSTYIIRYGTEIAGFGFLTQFRKKKAYDRTADIGLYIKPEFTGKGIGRKATSFLEAIAITKQIKVIIASISGENAPSIKLCEKMGYEKCAHYKEVGEKFGRLLDVVEYQKILHNSVPEGPRESKSL